MSDAANNIDTNNYKHLLTYDLPFRHRPGTDIMSKLILQDPKVVNMMVKVVVGDNAFDKYFSAKCECKSGKTSDMVLTTKQKSLPPPLLSKYKTLSTIPLCQNSTNTALIQMMNTVARQFQLFSVSKRQQKQFSKHHQFEHPPLSPVLSPHIIGQKSVFYWTQTQIPSSDGEELSCHRWAPILDMVVFSTDATENIINKLLKSVRTIV
ncbi:hypothetical protein INT45_007303 [Circinella minor]|uniref:Uncharacterized protein n=1 Tax=Circinella minor TaxID=1195481 RepID=A0A8H7VMI3_9FUNG|nr:hypothetical protein INT45_007303 [Circinella minor]